jgi:HEXXH motif-containing protein
MLRPSPEFVEDIRERIRAGEPCWFPGLADMLVERFWGKVRGISPSGYTTEGWLRGTPPGATLAIRGQTRMMIEELPAAFHCRFAAPSFAEVAPMAATAIAAALPHLGPMGAREAVASLVRSIHCVAARGLGYDCSHSEPSIPFSVFLSIPFGERHAELRLAESLLHETMHLQLTLMERLAPIIVGDASSGYSPWQQSERPVQGLLHGLYVFAAIHRWLQCLATEPALPKDDRAYVDRRLGEIEEEISAVETLSRAPGLTHFGRSLADWLLVTIRTL